ncbi:conserved hypothetical protein [Microsporum canis CBS 113480]|uniref:Uncharacterized protein n=1 Tax=Arthroderma otae (strain ATCC MYA-4605 / CBS 113480) TaxID=554155 RepID=C5FGW5_ARTOC|nr:conserved hypothetical protein [Microsporum canis CBS 113480]EEQ30000.1 conserved hypothetical protein [Microsporum canis CBS 113480]
MRLLSVLLVAVTAAASSTAMQQQQTELFYQPVVPASKPVELAQISYDPTTLRSKVVSYTPPEPSSPQADGDLIRVSVSPQSSGWAGVLSSRALLQPSPSSSHVPTLSLYLDAEGRVYHVGISSSPPSRSSPAGSHQSQAGKPSPVNVQLVRSGPAAVVQLNKPIVRRVEDPDDEQIEVPLANSLLQK